MISSAISEQCLPVAHGDVKRTVAIKAPISNPVIHSLCNKLDRPCFYHKIVATGWVDLDQLKS